MEQQTIPYYAHEGVVSRMERMNRRLWILCIVLVLLLAVTNGGWIWYESQFCEEQTSVTQELESTGGDAIINDGVRINGESTTDGDPQNKTQENRW